MIIKISNLNVGEHHFVFEDKVDVLDLDKPFYGKYKSSVKLNKLHDQLILSVDSVFKVKFECDRCGTEFKTSLKSDYQMIYLMNESPEETDSLNVAYLNRDADKIDLKSDVREFALLSIPMKKLCKEDCKGLCYKCGADLNIEKCSCQQHEIDDRWKPLMILKDKFNSN